MIPLEGKHSQWIFHVTTSVNNCFRFAIPYVPVEVSKNQISFLNFFQKVNDGGAGRKITYAK